MPAVKRAALVNVVRDVGDVHAQPEAAARQHVDRNRIVETRVSSPSMVTVGHGRKSVRSAMSFSRTVVPRRVARARLRRCASGKTWDDDGCPHPRIDRAEHFGDAPQAGRPSVSVISAVTISPCAARRARRALAGPRSAGDRTARRPLPRLVEFIAPDDALCATLENVEMRPSARSRRRDAPRDDHTITVHRLVQVRAGDVELAGPSSDACSGSTNAKPRVGRHAADTIMRSGSPKRCP